MPRPDPNPDVLAEVKDSEYPNQNSNHSAIGAAPHSANESV